MQQQSGTRFFSVLCAERVQMRRVGQARASIRLDLDGQQSPTGFDHEVATAWDATYPS